MSKFVKQLLMNGVKNRLTDVNSLMLVTLTGISAKVTHTLRGALAEKGIQVMVVKNSAAKRATEGTPLSVGFDGMAGSYALCWGATDIVALAKEVVKLSKDKAYKGFEIKGAVIDGEAYDAVTAAEVSKWPTREEQIAIIMGQIVGVGSKLSGQLIGSGGALVSQFKQLAEKEEAPVA
ncbi:MAG TPA: 50S ribosomal protein L10 [Planctomycetaceae bacterium]|nr:50S ribosomal protein L10 [Planctomycetaceae bacterium]